MTSRPSPGRCWYAGIVLAIAAACSGAAMAEAPVAEETIAGRDQRLIAQALDAMPPQRPGQPDLYVLGFAGDGTEDVFRNEVLYLEQLMNGRFQAQGRVIGLVNHPDSLDDASPRPLATLDNLALALAGIGAAMDPDEDLLLLFITSHGTEDHQLVAELAPFVEEGIRPAELAGTLDASGVRNRVVVVSACFSGGFLPPLRSPDAVVITAARKDRTSFGCGAASQVTYFGQAWLVDALNRQEDFIAAFSDARALVAQREEADTFTPSLPQIHVGERIEPVLKAWRESLQPGPAVPYPYLDQP
ncbi:MAG: C13 family peptidase [Luteimonas sp.]